MHPVYVIVTPAYNEAEYIELTIKSVLSQTAKPLLWIIVDDGSADETPLIIRRYTTQYPWIRYYRREKVPGQLYYASNVFAIQEGISHLGGMSYDYMAILDADISLYPQYYEQILFRLSQDEKFGIASGVIKDRLPSGGFQKVILDRRSTPKAIMVFRRSCFEQIGGFVPMKYGGEDTLACFMARMKGWNTWSFPDFEVIHNKPAGTGHASSSVRFRFRLGWGEWFLGTQPLFFFLKCVRRCVIEPPFIFGGLARMMGFLCGCVSKERRQISDELVRYIRREQWKRVIRWNTIAPDTP